MLHTRDLFNLCRPLFPRLPIVRSRLPVCDTHTRNACQARRDDLPLFSVKVISGASCPGVDVLAGGESSRERVIVSVSQILRSRNNSSNESVQRIPVFFTPFLIPLISEKLRAEAGCTWSISRECLGARGGPFSSFLLFFPCVDPVCPFCFFSRCFRSVFLNVPLFLSHCRWRVSPRCSSSIPSDCLNKKRPHE